MEWRVDVQEDRPERGMWHCGPNSCWVTVTHMPTMISATAYSESQWKARNRAKACVEMMLAEEPDAAPRFLERMQHEKAPPTEADGVS